MGFEAPVNSRGNWQVSWVWIATILLTLVAIILHIHFFRHAGGLWRDEANLTNVANSSTFADMSGDSFPILMPLIVHGWGMTKFGGTDIGLRCLGLLIGLSMIGMLWVSSWILHRKPPLLGLAFFALNVTAIIYGDEIRPYGLGAVFAIATIPTAWLLLSKPSPATFAVFMLVAVLGTQSNYFNIPLVFSACLAGTIQLERMSTVWRACGDETKTSFRASTGGAPNSAAPN